MNNNFILLNLFCCFSLLLSSQIEILLVIIDIFIKELFGFISDKERKNCFLGNTGASALWMQRSGCLLTLRSKHAEMQCERSLITSS